jgi:hypothetical protein
MSRGKVAERVMLGDTPYILSKDENGKEELVQDYEAQLAKLDVCARISRREKPKIKYVKGKR